MKNFENPQREQLSKFCFQYFKTIQGVYYVFTHLEFWVVEKWLILQQTSVNTKCTLISQTPLLKISLRSSNHGLCYSCVGYQRSNSKFTHLHSYALTLARARLQPHKFDSNMITDPKQIQLSNQRNILKNKIQFSKPLFWYHPKTLNADV